MEHAVCSRQTPDKTFILIASRLQLPPRTHSVEIVKFYSRSAQQFVVSNSQNNFVSYLHLKRMRRSFTSNSKVIAINPQMKSD